MEQDGAGQGSPSREALGIDLRSIELFRSVDLAAVAPLLRGCPVRSLQAGERLIEAGRPNSSLHVVLSGRLAVHLA
jgi:CRP-like cAMP-binding protein